MIDRSIMMLPSFLQTQTINHASIVLAIQEYLPS